MNSPFKDYGYCAQSSAQHVVSFRGGRRLCIDRLNLYQRSQNASPLARVGLIRGRNRQSKVEGPGGFHHPLGAVDPLVVRYFLTEMTKRNLSVDGYNRYLRALRRFFDFLYMGGVVDSVTPRFTRGERIGRRIPRVLGEAQVIKLTRCARNTRDRAANELLYATGCRMGEFVRIQVEDAVLKRRHDSRCGQGKGTDSFLWSNRYDGH